MCHRGYEIPEGDTYIILLLLFLWFFVIPAQRKEPEVAGGRVGGFLVLGVARQAARGDRAFDNALFGLVDDAFERDM